jgi:streptomycin 6-kinase
MAAAPVSLIPAHFERTTIELYGERGVTWLARLPILLAGCEQRWSLTVQPPFALSYNYVCPARRVDGTEVVLKAGVPNPELLAEIAALQLCSGRGMARLLEADEEQGVLVIERLRPGTPLADLADDDEATRIVARVMQQLWQPVPAEHSFPSVARWAAGLQKLRPHFGGTTGPLPQKLVETAEALFVDLLASMESPVVLHGDLHHWNILSAEREPWLALDPKGIVGEPAYEVGAWLRNQMAGPTRMARRVAIFSEALGVDRQRLIGWGLAQAVLSAWWSIEDHGHGWEEAIACAEMLQTLRL